MRALRTLTRARLPGLGAGRLTGSKENQLAKSSSWTRRRLIISRRFSITRFQLRITKGKARREEVFTQQTRADNQQVHSR